MRLRIGVLALAALVLACEDGGDAGLTLRVEPSAGACDASLMVTGEGFLALADDDRQVLVAVYAGDFDATPDAPIATFVIARLDAGGKLRTPLDLGDAAGICGSVDTVTIVAADGGPGAITHYRVE